MILKKCAPFKSWIAETNNIQVHNSQDVDIVMPMYSLLEYSGNYSNTSESLFQYYRDEPAFNNDVIFVGFEDNNTNDSLKFKQQQQKKTSHTGKDDTKKVAIIVPLKHLSNFWRIHEIPLINCKVNLIQKWSTKCVTPCNAFVAQAITFAIKDTNLYAPVAILSILVNPKLFEQLKLGFKRIINLKNK